MTTDTAINVVFPDRIDKRAQVVFRELLAMTIKYASLHPDREAIDLINRAKGNRCKLRQAIGVKA